MKKLLNKKMIIPALLLVLIFVIVMFYSLGFRITYAPEIENSWNAVSAVSSCVGVLASFIAIWFAIRVPKQIAEQQNKIALFEKRFNFYQALMKCISLGESLKNLKQPINFEDCQRLIVLSLTLNPIFYTPIENVDLNEEVFKAILNIKGALDGAEFLFDFEKDSYDYSYLNNLFKLSSPKNINEISNNIEKYEENIETIKKNILPIVKEALALKMK